jgi:hypothetical protein
VIPYASAEARTLFTNKQDRMSTPLATRIHTCLILCCLGVFLLPMLSFAAVDADMFRLVSKNTPKRAAVVNRPQQTALRGPAEVQVVTGLAGHAGYVHYFVITGPDGEPETQVGIELEDGRIAWSFPEAGVFLAPFLAAGSFTIGNVRYEIEHLYGLRPFRDEASMRTFAKELSARIAPYVEESTPYCDESGNTDRYCLSCLGFVLRVLYPGATRAFPALPADFKAARRMLYSTEDLLLYLTGVPVDASRAARTRRIEGLAVPAALRDELVRISAGIEDASPTVASSKPKRATSSKARAAAPPAESPRRVTGRRS